jgi:hypothetical protein
MGRYLFHNKVFVFSGLFTRDIDIESTEEYQLITKRGGSVRTDFEGESVEGVDYVLSVRYKREIISDQESQHVQAEGHPRDQHPLAALLRDIQIPAFN